MDWFLLIIGLTFLLGGGDLLVRGATGLAKRLGVSPLVIGLTVVAMGTSAPELAVNMMAALKGQVGISFGNIIGSNIANTALILGAAALMRPLNILPSVTRRELPIMLAATAAVLLALSEGLFGNAIPAVGRLAGILLLLGFVFFLYLTFRRARRDRQAAALAEQAVDEAGPKHQWGITASSLLTLGGIVAVILGSNWTVEGAVGIAQAFGVSEAVIGLTIIAIGTSLPELVTSIAAVRAGQSDLAVGNVVGSNIFNLLFVLGPTAIIAPIALPEGGGADLIALSIVSLALLMMALGGKHHITRRQGGILLICYWLYLIWRSFG